MADKTYTRVYDNHGVEIDILEGNVYCGGVKYPANLLPIKAEVRKGNELIHIYRIEKPKNNERKY